MRGRQGVSGLEGVVWQRVDVAREGDLHSADDRVGVRALHDEPNATTGSGGQPVGIRITRTDAERRGALRLAAEALGLESEADLTICAVQVFRVSAAGKDGSSVPGSTSHGKPA